MGRGALNSFEFMNSYPNSVAQVFWLGEEDEGKRSVLALSTSLSLVNAAGAGAAADLTVSWDSKSRMINLNGLPSCGDGSRRMQTDGIWPIKAVQIGIYQKPCSESQCPMMLS